MKLYKKSAAGKMMVWEIEIGFVGLDITFGQLGGSMQEKDVVIEENQSGRSWEEQAELEMNSRISKQMDKGYVTSIEKAEQGATNSLGMKMPMLASPHNESTSLGEEVFVQYKYDGNRCLITKQNGKVFAYSRNGKLIKSIDHIITAAKDIPEGTILDGELYHHGTALQTIRSWISRGQSNSKKLIYVLYDIMTQESYSKRLLRLEKLKLGDSIKLAKTTLEPSLGLRLELYKRLDIAIGLGYEGLILRKPSGKYQDGKRSKDLIKVKAWMDREFTVDAIESTSDGWGVLYMTCNGRVFKATAPGTVEDKIDVANNPDNYIGKTVTIQYANLTKGRVPFHPVATAWRDGNE